MISAHRGDIFVIEYLDEIEAELEITLACLSGETISAVCNTPLRWSLCTPQRRSQRCATHDLRGVQHIGEINCTPRNQNQNLHLTTITFKETIRRNTFRGEHIYHIRKDLKTFFWFAKKFFFISAVCNTPQRQLCDRKSLRNRNWIRKYLSLFIRGPDGFESWKKWRSKISWHTPFKTNI